MRSGLLRFDHGDLLSPFALGNAVTRLPVTIADGPTRTHDSVYDELGRIVDSVISSTETGGWTERPFFYEYSYDTGNAWYERTGPDDVETYVVLDDAGRVSHVRRGPELDPIMTATYTYHQYGLVDTATYGNGAWTVYEYDFANRVKSIDHRGLTGTIRKLAYTYYDNDLPETITETGLADTPIATTTFEYDSRGRLTRESRVRQSPYDFEYDLAYEYDQGGNRTKKTDNLTGHETEYTYDYQDQAQFDTKANRLMTYVTATATTAPGDTNPTPSTKLKTPTKPSPTFTSATATMTPHPAASCNATRWASWAA